MILWGRHSDRTHERRWHLALPGVFGMLGFLCGGFATNVYVSIAAFSVGAIGIYSSLPLFWTVLTGHVSGPAAAAGIALINSVGNLSGYFGPYLIGWLKDSTKGYTAGLLLIAASLAASAALGFALSRRPVEIATV
jgi:cyanate permease